MQEILIEIFDKPLIIIAQLISLLDLQSIYH